MATIVTQTSIVLLGISILVISSDTQESIKSSKEILTDLRYILKLFPRNDACTFHIIRGHNSDHTGTVGYNVWLDRSLSTLFVPALISHEISDLPMSSLRKFDNRFSLLCYLFVLRASSKLHVVANAIERRSRDVILLVKDRAILENTHESPVLSSFKWKFFADVTLDLERLMIAPDTLKSCVNIGGGFQIFRRKINLSGVKLTVAGLAVPPFMLLNRDRKIVGGTFVKVFEAASGVYNFTYNLSTEKKPIGFPLPNGTWIGIIGDILYKRKDMGTCVRPTLQSFHLLDFTTFVFQEHALFLLAHPETLIRWTVLIRPFKLTLWLLFSICFLIFVPVFYATMKSAVKTERFQKDRSIYQAVMFPFATSLEQGGEIGSGSRFLAGLWLLSVVILTCGYKEKLMASLTFPETFPIPRNLKEVHQRKDFRLIFHNWGSTMLDEFKNAYDPVMLGIYKRLELEKDAAKCVTQAVFHQRTLCIGVLSFLGVAMGRNLTLSSTFRSYRTSEGGDLFFPFYISIPLQKNSKYTAAWEEIGGKLRESGLITRWNADVLASFRREGREWMLSQKDGKEYQALAAMIGGADRSVKKLMVKHFAAVFLTIFICILICACAFMYEYRIAKTKVEPIVAFVLSKTPDEW